MNMNTSTTTSSAASRSSKRKNYYRMVPTLTYKSFTVKSESTLKATSLKLELDLERGKLKIIKAADDQQLFDHTNILQIIKNTQRKHKLSIVFDTGKKREFSFEANIERELFCQLVQQIRNSHSHTEEPDHISVFCGTWNMGNALPPEDLTSWFLCAGLGRCLDATVTSQPHDLYVIGVQESTDKEWNRRVSDTLHDVFPKHRFHQVVSASLWQMKILVLCREEHQHRISHIKTSDVKTGIANALGNKGAVGVSFDFGGSPFCFINSHLTSGAEKCARRNQNYHSILRELALGSDRLKQFSFTNKFEHLFFFGDLNYRLNLQVEEILQGIRHGDYQSLLNCDQLRIEKDALRVFNRFQEDDITFPPTYRYERGTRDHYSHLKVKTTCVKVNVPSWCDRVLCKSYPRVYNISTAYGCCDDIMTSDHSPVFASFNLGVRSQYASKQGVRSGEGKSSEVVGDGAQITLTNVEVKLKKASGRKTFTLEFHSDCLPDCEKSGGNSGMESCEEDEVELKWNKLPQLKPFVSDLEYLVDQHLLVGIKCQDESEYVGECVIALRNISKEGGSRFMERVTHKENDVGFMTGFLNITCNSNSFRSRANALSRRVVKEKTYEFIQIGNMRDEPDLSSSNSHLGEKDSRLTAPSISPTFPRCNVNNETSSSSHYHHGNHHHHNNTTTSTSHAVQPNSLEEMLASVGMVKHATKLIEAGWDHLQFIREINEEDLMEAGVRTEVDRKIILDRIRQLP